MEGIDDHGEIEMILGREAETVFFMLSQQQQQHQFDRDTPDVTSAKKTIGARITDRATTHLRNSYILRPKLASYFSVCGSGLIFVIHGEVLLCVN